jgi:pimeloyl-ACP methyl ester carboxylesterase
VNERIAGRIYFIGDVDLIGRSSTNTYVLVHGAWHGSWCWDKIVPLLEQAGHTAVAPDLPGQGKDRTPIKDITFRSYVQRVCDTVNAQVEPVILVGHSMAGAVITQVAEECPDRLKMLVYLCAFLPGNGESLADWSQRDKECLLPKHRVYAEDGSCSTIRDDALKEVFYADCPDEDVRRARSLLRPQATAPLRVPVSTTDENFGHLPRVYIETLQDRAISPSLQRRMYEALPCQRVIKMNTSHSPFFSAPETLVAHMTSL